MIIYSVNITFCFPYIFLIIPKSFASNGFQHSCLNTPLFLVHYERSRQKIKAAKGTSSRQGPGSLTDNLFFHYTMSHKVWESTTKKSDVNLTQKSVTHFTLQQIVDPVILVTPSLNKFLLKYLNF